MKKKKKSQSFIQGRIESIRVAINGIVYATYSQRNLQIELVLGVIAIALAIITNISPLEWGLLMISIALVLICEMINTAIELSIDLSTKKQRYRAMLGKDVAAGAVVMSSLLAIGIGYLIFFHRLVTLLTGGE